jgi:hypothetical protein
MTELLQRAIAAVAALTADAQDAIAARLLEDVADEVVWEARFRSTTDAEWDRIAEAVRRDIAAGDVTPLDDVFPAGASA